MSAAEVHPSGLVIPKASFPSVGDARKFSNSSVTEQNTWHCGGGDFEETPQPKSLSSGHCDIRDTILVEASQPEGGANIQNIPKTTKNCTIYAPPTPHFHMHLAQPWGGASKWSWETWRNSISTAYTEASKWAHNAFYYVRSYFDVSESVRKERWQWMFNRTVTIVPGSWLVFPRDHLEWWFGDYSGAKLVQVYYALGYLARSFTTGFDKTGQKPISFCADYRVSADFVNDNSKWEGNKNRWEWCSFGGRMEAVGNVRMIFPCAKFPGFDFDQRWQIVLHEMIHAGLRFGHPCDTSCSVASNCTAPLRACDGPTDNRWVLIKKGRTDDAMKNNIAYNWLILGMADGARYSPDLCYPKHVADYTNWPPASF